MFSSFSGYIHILDYLEFWYYDFVILRGCYPQSILLIDWIYGNSIF